MWLVILGGRNRIILMFAETILNEIRSSKKETDYARIGNKVLYDLCKEHPNHNDEAEIIAKVWLIGRSYAASIERSKNRKKKVSNDFFKDEVALKFKHGNAFDNCISKVIDIRQLTEKDIPIILEAHKKATDLIKEITGDNKRSFVSKYLHFHFPNLFFIYDSRVAGVINKVVYDCEIPHKKYKEFLPKDKKKTDVVYADFFVKCFLLKQFFASNHILITPREIDNYLIKKANPKLKF